MPEYKCQRCGNDVFNVYYEAEEVQLCPACEKRCRGCPNIGDCSYNQEDCADFWDDTNALNRSY